MVASEKVESSPAAADVDTKSMGEAYLELKYTELASIKPSSSWALAWANFKRQLRSGLEQAAEKVGIQKNDELKPPYCLGLVLSNEAVSEAERKREEAGGRIDAHPVSRTLYDIGCLFLDNLFEGRPIQRFWFLETVARIPYFSYTTMLHLYESFGWWRAPELRKVHNAEEWNELHHLLILEALGGNLAWSDRFLAYHAAIVYYWFLLAVYLCSPRIAYQFMELLESHAVDTYGTFVRMNRARLKALPPPTIAVNYYTSSDLYLFDDFQMRTPGTRRPPCDSLLDVFQNICEDEGEHVKTMRACQEYAVQGTPVVSPHKEQATEPTPMTASEKRKLWQSWAAAVNEANCVLEDGDDL